MMKTNSKLIIGIIIIIALILAMGTVTFADPIIIGGNTANSQNDTANVQNETNTENTVPNVIANTSSNTTNSTSYRNNTQNTLPKTGVTDGYVVAILVAICAISAIYAYKKIRDYNA